MFLGVGFVFAIVPVIPVELGGLNAVKRYRKRFFNGNMV